MSDQSQQPRVSVDIVIPVLNEAHVLAKSVATVYEFLSNGFGYNWRITIVDNGSEDGTQDVAARLSEEYSRVAFLHLEHRGRGRALRYAWLKSEADIVCYTDVDLSTDLKHLPELVDAIATEGYDIAIGSRLMRQSTVKRSLKREVISQGYNLLLRAILGTRFTDAQCGFKAVSRAAVDAIVPRIQDQSWFFDTELLVLGEWYGYRIKNVPVVWIEDDDSRVKILRTAWDDIKGVLRLRNAARQVRASATIARRHSR